ncbi:MAG: hypothetical protein K6346_02905, partial [Halothiobacillaceae bacterium]
MNYYMLVDKKDSCSKGFTRCPLQIKLPSAGYLANQEPPMSAPRRSKLLHISRNFPPLWGGMERLN